ncbi:hypothetical protein [Paracoccus sp. DMF]|uniref:hypothetical protein n=1 Tax=Paracoccus sp. DMF TaxID=400837 RepID=UPI0011007866|nr:hypothetical protein [Paracoccus sp. DMF]MCV2448830.1 hypothetical protein [Paracoccus sp. DMF]
MIGDPTLAHREVAVPYAGRLAETLREAVHVIEQMGRLGNQVRVAMVSTARNCGPHLVQQFLRRRPAAQVKISIADRDSRIAFLEIEARLEVSLGCAGRQLAPMSAAPA